MLNMPFRQLCSFVLAYISFQKALASQENGNVFGRRFLIELIPIFVELR